jgi:hypothetical protein
MLKITGLNLITLSCCKVDTKAAQKSTPNCRLLVTLLIESNNVGNIKWIVIVSNSVGVIVN